MPTISTPNLSRTRRAFGRRAGSLAAMAGGLALAVSGLAAPVANAQPRPSSTSSAAALTVDQQAARWGAGYLAAQLTAGDGALSSFGSVDIPNTAYAVIALHAAGVGSAAADQGLAFLKTQVATGLSVDGNDDPGRLGYTILAALSAGQNPRAFGGTGAQNNLVNRLLASSRSAGADKGLFGAGDPTFDGTFREGVALSALKGAGVTKSKVAANIAWLTAQQCASGFWVSYRTNTHTACPPVDFSTFTGPDTNSSAMAAQGLAAYGNTPRKALLLNAFHRIQTSDGGFPYLAAPRQSSDPDSTALVIQGLLAYGAKADLPGYKVAGQTPYAALRAFQLGCGDPAGDRGAFFYPGDRSANLLATVQAVPALARTTFPLAKSTLTSEVPHPLCAVGAPQVTAAAATTSATASATTSAALAGTAGTAGACKGSTGVTVAVDFTGFAGGAVQVRCAPGQPATGVAALQQAGFTPAGTARYGLAFICRINNKPTPTQQPCTNTPPATASWSYFHAAKGATKWTFSSQGPSTFKPTQGSIEAWAFGNKATPSKTPAQVRAAKK